MFGLACFLLQEPKWNMSEFLVLKLGQNSHYVIQVLLSSKAIFQYSCITFQKSQIQLRKKKTKYIFMVIGLFNGLFKQHVIIQSKHSLSSRLLFKNLKIKIYKKIILTVVLYGCETWSFTFREQCRLWVFENKILRRIFGHKRDENEEWRRLHNEELHSLHPTRNIYRVNIFILFMKL